MMRSHTRLAWLAIALAVAATPDAWPAAPAAAPARCAGADPELTLARGCSATVFADHLGHPRHVVVSPDGTVYVNTWSGRYYAFDTRPAGGFIVALRDSTGHGHADQVERFGPDAVHGGHRGTGIALIRGALYAEEGGQIWRYPLAPGRATPSGAPTLVVDGRRGESARASGLGAADGRRPAHA